MTVHWERWNKQIFWGLMDTGSEFTLIPETTIAHPQNGGLVETGEVMTKVQFSSIYVFETWGNDKLVSLWEEKGTQLRREKFLRGKEVQGRHVNGHLWVSIKWRFLYHIIMSIRQYPPWKRYWTVSRVVGFTKVSQTAQQPRLLTHNLSSLSLTQGHSCTAIWKLVQPSQSTFIFSLAAASPNKRCACLIQS